MRIWGLLLLVALVDYASKHYIKATMEEGMSRPVVDGVFHITYILNPGAAFGLFDGQRWLFILAAILLLGAFLVFFAYIKKQGLLLQTGAALFAGGALGNLFDRIRFGKVVDFLDFRIWPVFNVADMAICVGAGCILWVVLKNKQ